MIVVRFVLGAKALRKVCFCVCDFAIKYKEAFKLSFSGHILYMEVAIMKQPAITAVRSTYILRRIDEI